MEEKKPTNGNDQHGSASEQPQAPRKEEKVAPPYTHAKLPHLERGEKAAIAESDKKLSRRVLLSLLIVAFAVFIPIMIPFVVPVILAITFTTLFYPSYRWLLRRLRYRRKTTSAIFCLLFLLLLLIPSYVVVNLVVRQAIELYASLEPTIRDILERGSESEIVKYLNRSRIAQFLRLTEINWREILEETARGASGIATTIINRTSAGVFGLFLNLFIMIFTMFYFFVDGPRITNAFRNILPMRREYEDMIIDRFTLISRATVTATLLIGLAQGSAGGLTLYIFGVGSWLLWGFIMIILSIIPLVGTWLVLIPASIIQIVVGNFWAGLGIFLSSTLIVSNLDNLIRPRVVGHGAKVHDLLIFFSTIGGLSYFGVMGFIIGPAIASFLISILDIYSKEFRSQIEAAK